MKAIALIVGCLVGLALHQSALAQPPSFVGVAGSGDTYSHRYWVLAVEADGDWYSAEIADFPLEWTPRGNVFAMAGSGGGSPIVAFMPPWAVTANGDVYSGGGNIGITEYWTFVGNVGDMTSHPLGSQRLVGLGRSQVGVDWAVTDRGEIYAYYYTAPAPCPTPWCYVGNVTGLPTPEIGDSWGGLKTRYR